MSQKTSKIFINKIQSEGPEKIYATSKTDVYQIDDIWSLDILDLKNYGSENNRGCSFVLVTIEIFNEFRWTVPLNSKNAQTIENPFENNLISSKSKPNFFDTDRGKEFYNNNFQDFLNKNNIKTYSRNISVGAVFAEGFNRTIRDFVKRSVFEKGESDWIDILPTLTKQYENRIHSSTKLTPVRAILKKK